MTDAAPGRRATRIPAILLATALALFGSTTTTAPAAAEQPETLDVRGVLRVTANEGAHAPEGTTVTLVTDDGTMIELTGPEVAGVASGTSFEGAIEVPAELARHVADADSNTEAVEIVASEQTAPVEVVSAAIEAPVAAAVTARTHKVDVIWAAPSGYAKPNAAAIDEWVSRMSDFWSSQSNGQVAAVIRETSVIYATRSTKQLCDPDYMWRYAAGASGFNRASDEYYWHNPGGSTHLMVVVPGSVCGVGSGLGSVGSLHDGGLTWSSVDTDPARWDLVTFHETGHNLGLGHSNVTECDPPIVDGASCGQKEYYDFYDVMGGGMTYSGVTNFHDLGALNMSHKVNLGAVDRGASPSIVTVDPASGDKRVTLSAAGLDTGLRGLEVRGANGDRVFVEYRSPVGRDANAFYKRVAAYTNVYSPGIRVLKLDCPAASSACAGAASTVLRNPDGSRLSYRAGETYAGRVVSGAQVRITVASTTQNSATVDVAFVTDAVDPTPTVRGATPTISGTPAVGKTLTAKPGTWTTGSTFAYRWYANGTAISKATSSKLTLTASHVGKRITAKVTGTRAGWNTTAKTSKATAAVAKGTLSVAAPKISGTVKVKSKLTAKPAKISGATMTYQWYVGGKAVSKATKSTFVLRTADRGKTVQVKVTYKKSGYTTLKKTSAKTSKVR